MLMATSLLPLILNEGNTSLPVHLVVDRLRFLQCDLASQSDKLSAVEVVEVSMHGLTCQRMSRMLVSINVVSMVRVLALVYL